MVNEMFGTQMMEEVLLHFLLPFAITWLIVQLFLWRMSACRFTGHFGTRVNNPEWWGADYVCIKCAAPLEYVGKEKK